MLAFTEPRGLRAPGSELGGWDLYHERVRQNPPKLVYDPLLDGNY